MRLDRSSFLHVLRSWHKTNRPHFRNPRSFWQVSDLILKSHFQLHVYWDTLYLCLRINARKKHLKWFYRCFYIFFQSLYFGESFLMDRKMFNKPRLMDESQNTQNLTIISSVIFSTELLKRIFSEIKYFPQIKFWKFLKSFFGITVRKSSDSRFCSETILITDY